MCKEKYLTLSRKDRQEFKEDYPKAVLNIDDWQQIDRALALIGAVLEADIVGVYLFGSAVMGGLRAESDLDLLVVSKRRTTHAEKQRLVEGLLAVSGRKTAQGMWRRIELTIVVESDVKPWRYPPSFDFQYGDWLRSEFESGNIEPWPTRVNPDLALLITMVVQANTPLLGPPPAEIFEGVPDDDLRRAMADGIEGLRDDIDSDTHNVILTLARMWSTLATGVIRSKDAAADWALERLPEAQRPALRRARAIYLGEQVEGSEELEDQIGPHAEYVVAEIRRLVRAKAENLVGGIRD